jgi:hypothetical protein
MDRTALRTLYAIVVAGLLLVPSDAVGGARRGCGPSGESALTLTAGRYDPDAERAESATVFGIEGSRYMYPLFEIGFAGEFFYADRDGAPIFFDVDERYPIPVESDVRTFHSSARFGQAGIAARLRLPMLVFGPTPFLRGGMFLQLLHQRITHAPVEDVRRMESDSETFAGLGWQLGAGIDQPLDRHVSLLGELGYTHAELGKPFDPDHDGEVRRVARASGLYVRAGLQLRH